MSDDSLGVGPLQTVGKAAPAISHYQYLLLMLGCLLVTLPLEIVLGARVYRRPRALAQAVLPVVVIFTVWDVFGIVAQQWRYNPAFITGVRLIFGMPLEELVFFVVVPICGLLTYEAVGQMLTRWRERRFRPDLGGDVCEQDRSEGGRNA